MQILFPIQKEEFKLKKIICDCCKKEIYVGHLEINEVLSIKKENGYGSIFGDGTILICDLCQECVKEVLGKYSTVLNKGDIYS